MAHALLLRTINDQRLEQLLSDSDWCIQQKYDGVRAIVSCLAGELTATGRSGKPIDLGYVGTQFPTDQNYTLDGELAYGYFFAFDELSEPNRPYIERLSKATSLVTRWHKDRIRRVRTWRSESAKRAALAKARAERVEGVVLRNLTKPWKRGADSNVAVRYKFVKRCECALLSIGETGRKSATVGMFTDSGELVIVGNVPIGRRRAWQECNEALEMAADKPDPPVIEVQYLYATESGKLYQPSFVRVRWDKSAMPADCNVSQLQSTHMGEMDGGVVQKDYPDPVPSERPQSSRARSSRSGRRDADSEPIGNWGGWLKWFGLGLWWVLLLFVWFLQALPQGRTVKPARKLTMGGGGGDM